MKLKIIKLFINAHFRNGEMLKGCLYTCKLFGRSMIMPNQHLQSQVKKCVKIIKMK